MDLQDSLAYVANITSLQIVNVARPDSPRVVGVWGGYAAGVDVVDTVAYVVGGNCALWTLSVANPSAPRVLDSVSWPGYDGEDVVVVGATAYTGENVIHIIDVSDPDDLRVTGMASVPNWTPRLCYAAPYLYACCAEGGVCVMETVPSGIAERKPSGTVSAARVYPSPTRGRVMVELPFRAEGRCEWRIRDVAGREMCHGTLASRQTRVNVNIGDKPAGVYMVEVKTQTTVVRVRVVKL
jgi:hypothetical protein